MMEAILLNPTHLDLTAQFRTQIVAYCECFIIPAYFEFYLVMCSEVLIIQLIIIHSK